jgi:hypothetical protein
MTEILTPQSKRWEVFCETLYLSLYPDGGDRSICAGAPGKDRHRHAKQIMADMGGVDIDKSIAFFEYNGGYCACEILFNVDP